MKKILLLAATAALWTSCTNDDSCGNRSANAIRLSATIATVKPMPTTADTRTAITGSTAAWINGDALGLYCEQSTPAAVNDQFTVANVSTTPSWTPATAIYWTDGVSAHKFLAYAPYASGNTSPTAVKIAATGTQTGTIDPAQDFLISNNLYTTGITRTGSVGLVFTHALALVEFDVTLGAGIAAGTTLVSTVLAGASGEKLYITDNASTINLATGAITVSAGTNTATVTPASPVVISGTAIPIYTLLVPATYTGPTLTVNIKEGGTAALTTASAALGTTKFDPGKKYTYAVSISRTAITISNPQITDWVVVSGSPITPGI